MRSPLQGGLPPVNTVAGVVVEIACDESGFSGTNLLHPTSPLITHASVDLRAGEAAELITTLRSGFRFSPHEFKSSRRGTRCYETRSAHKPRMSSPGSAVPGCRPC